MINIAINGFGRIGRLALRSAMMRDSKLNITHINDLSDAKTLAHLFKYDSTHGIFQGDVSADDNSITINGRTIQVSQIAALQDLPWQNKSQDKNIDCVLECTGLFTTHEKASGHIQAGAKKVLVSAPCENADATIVYGINHDCLSATDTIISNASCTTNCLAPVAYVLQKHFGIQQGFMTTIHSYTGDQMLLDASHKNLLRARAAALSMVPSTTGAAKAIGLVLPELQGKLDGTAVRVPTNNVSLVNLVVDVEKNVTKESINDIFRSEAEHLKGVMDVCDVPLVSVDYNHNAHSAIVDLNETYVSGDNMVRVLAWYDNEWGFANRMIDLLHYMSGQDWL